MYVFQMAGRAEYQADWCAAMLESIEGLSTGSHLVYRFKAKIVRGKLSHDIIAKRHMRIVRTLASTAEELRLTTVCTMRRTYAI